MSQTYYFCIMRVKEFLEKGRDYFLPNLSIDIVIIGYKENSLQCLLLQIGDKWLLPGGYIKKDESVDEAAFRLLKERTSLEEPHLKFLSVFGDGNRQFGQEWKDFLKKEGMPWNKDHWFNNRFVTLAYYSLVNLESTRPAISGIDEAFSWFNFDDLPDMWMDHEIIIMEARNRLKKDVKRELMTYNLLPKHFTMPELHQLHQTILGENLDRSRFQKKMLSSGMFERLPKRKKESPGRNPYQYRVKREEA